MTLYCFSSFLCWIRTTAKSATLTFFLFQRHPHHLHSAVNSSFSPPHLFHSLFPGVISQLYTSLSLYHLVFKPNGSYNQFSKHKDDIKSWFAYIICSFRAQKWKPSIPCIATSSASPPYPLYPLCQVLPRHRLPLRQPCLLCPPWLWEARHQRSELGRAHICALNLPVNVCSWRKRVISPGYHFLAHTLHSGPLCPICNSVQMNLCPQGSFVTWVKLTPAWPVLLLQGLAVMLYVKPVPQWGT